MKVNLENKSELERKLSIEVPAEAVQQSFKKATVKAQKESNLKGFRPGKAPLDTVKKMYTENIVRWATDDIINQHFIKGIMETKANIVGEPEFEFGWPKENENFEFAAYFEVYPEVKLTKVEGLAAERLKTQIDEKNVTDTITRLQGNWATWSPVDRAAQMGDQVTIKFNGEVAGKSDPRLSGEMPVELGSHQLIEGFEEGLVGLKKLDEKTLSLQFPQEYHAPDFAGQPVTFTVQVLEVSDKQLPELNDEFAKKFGKETLAELHDMISKDLSERIVKESKRHFEETLIRSLVAANPSVVPQFFVKKQKEHLIENFRQDWKQKGQPEAAIEDYISKWSADFERLANEMIQAEFLVMEIAKTQSIEASEADFELKMQENAAQTGIDIERVLSYYNEPKRKEQTMGTLTREKVVKFLSEKAQITDIDKIQDSTTQN